MFHVQLAAQANRSCCSGWLSHSQMVKDLPVKKGGKSPSPKPDPKAKAKAKAAAEPDHILEDGPPGGASHSSSSGMTGWREIEGWHFVGQHGVAQLMWWYKDSHQRPGGSDSSSKPK